MIEENTALHIAIIIPVLNEEVLLPRLLLHFESFRSRGCVVIFVDGGSIDNSVSLIHQAGFTVLAADCGRAKQMNAGAMTADADILLFLHADTLLPDNADTLIRQAMADNNATWGRFDVSIGGTSKMLAVIAFFMNFRSRLTGIATGDQAIFIRRPVFEKLGGFPDQVLMEDIELCKQLLELTKPICLYACVKTSGRRWEKHGVWRTLLLMWRLRYDYWRGTSPETLARLYS